MPCFIATNSAPMTLVLIVACCFENQRIGGAMYVQEKPVLVDRRVRSSRPVWLESTNMHKLISFPRGVGATLGGMALCASPENAYFQSHSVLNVVMSITR